MELDYPEVCVCARAEVDYPDGCVCARAKVDQRTKLRAREQLLAHAVLVDSGRRLLVLLQLGQVVLHVPRTPPISRQRTQALRAQFRPKGRTAKRQLLEEELQYIYLASKEGSSPEPFDTKT